MGVPACGAFLWSTFYSYRMFRRRLVVTDLGLALHSGNVVTEIPWGGIIQVTTSSAYRDLLVSRDGGADRY